MIPVRTFRVLTVLAAGLSVMLLAVVTMSSRSAALSLAASTRPAALNDARNVTASHMATDGTLVPLPAIDVGEGWRTAVHVQNVGDAPAVAIIDFYPASNEAWLGHLCPLKDEGVVKSQRSAVIEPGATWTFEAQPGMGLEAAKSAMVCSVRPDDPRSTCRSDSPAQPGAPLAVTVTRQGLADDGLTPISSAYSALHDAGIPSKWSGDYYAWAPQFTVGANNRSSTLIVQNIGQACVTVELWFMPRGIGRHATVAYYDLLPGFSIRLAEAALWSPPFDGQAWVRSAEPISVIVDQQDQEANVLMTYRAIPRQKSELASYAPFALSETAGWNTEIQIQNGSFFTGSVASLSALSFTGEHMVTATAGIAEYDTWEVPLQSVPNLPSTFRGALRFGLAMLPWESSRFSAADDFPGPYSVVSVVNPKKGQGYSYTPFLLDPSQGTTTVGLPWLVKGQAISDTLGVALISHFLIQNLNPGAGTTSVRVDFFGARERIGTTQVQLGPEAVQEINLADLTFLPDRFQGSARVQVTNSSQGAPPSIGVLVIEEATGDARGDWAQAYEGIPVIVAGTTSQPTPTPTQTATPISGTPAPSTTPTSTSTAAATATVMATLTNTVTATPTTMTSATVPAPAPSPTRTPEPTGLPRYKVYLPLVQRQMEVLTTTP